MELLRRESSWKLAVDIPMDDAGELPGVSMALRAAWLSSVTIVDTESRRRWCLAAFTSSSRASIALTLSWRVSERVRRSASRRIISPLTVNLSLIPFWIIDKTLSIADP